MKLVRYGTDQGQVVALAKEGRTRILVIQMDAAGIRVRPVPMSEGRWMEEIAYPPRKAARKFLRAGKLFGITKQARALLNEEIAR